jgi:hypothetical protein
MLFSVGYKRTISKRFLGISQKWKHEGCINTPKDAQLYWESEKF